MEVQRVEQLDRGVRRVHRHVGRRLEQRLGVVEDDLHARRDEVVRRALRRLRPGTASTPTTTLWSRTSSREALVRLDRDAPDRLPELRLVGVDDDGDVDPVLREDRGRGDRLPEPAGADERDVVLALRAQDLADRVEQELDRVADPALAELAEVGQVAADLRRVDVRVLGDLLRRDPSSSPSSAPASAPGGTGTGGRRRRRSSARPHDPPSARLRDSVLCCTSRSSRSLVQPPGAARRGARGRRNAAGRRSPRPGSTRGTRPRARGRRRSRPRAARSRARRAQRSTTRRAAAQRWQPDAV